PPPPSAPSSPFHSPSGSGPAQAAAQTSPPHSQSFGLRLLGSAHPPPKRPPPGAQAPTRTSLPPLPSSPASEACEIPPNERSPSVTCGLHGAAHSASSQSFSSPVTTLGCLRSSSALRLPVKSSP